MQEILSDWSRENLVVIYDHQGTRSMDAAAYFQGHGFDNVKSLRGGIDAWSVEVDPQPSALSLGTSMSDELERQSRSAVKNPQNLGEMERRGCDRHRGQRGLRRHAADVGEIQRSRTAARSSIARPFRSSAARPRSRWPASRRRCSRGKQSPRRCRCRAKNWPRRLGALPPVKIHCAQLVEGALRSALSGDTAR